MAELARGQCRSLESDETNSRGELIFIKRLDPRKTEAIRERSAIDAALLILQPPPASTNTDTNSIFALDEPIMRTRGC